MAEVQAHRGPDDQGIWHDMSGRCSLAHRRLSIIDTSSAGHQPMEDAHGRWVITFNGEIYNFKEVRAELEALGHHFRSRTDTEVLLDAIATWSVDALPRLDGMFAFAAFDRQSGQLVAARDPFGEKPLYYVELPTGGLAFASELQALERVPGVDLTVSPDAVAELLMFQYVGAPRTIYRQVKKLPPGHWLMASPGQLPSIRSYFQFRPGERDFDGRPIGELADELEDILVRSLRGRLIADVPLGAFLSGGLDSSTVCALIRRKLDVPLKTYSIGFDGAPQSEHRTARAFARHLGTDHHEKIVAPHASDFLYEIGRLLDEPNADSSCLPTYLLSQFARQSVTVALSGDGGDEMIGGYGRYFVTVDDAERVRSGSASSWSAGEAYYSNRILVSTEEHIAELFGGVPSGAAEHLRRLRESLRDSATPLLCRLRRTDVENYMPGAVLSKVDRMSMRHSLEVRTPFLNTELARFAERLPSSAMYAGKRGKLVLRELAYRYLPRRLVNLPKQGFALPMTRWGRTELLAVAAKLLESDDSRLRNSFGPAAIARFMKRQRSEHGFATYQVWALAMLESWLRHHDAKVPSMRMSRLNTGALTANDRLVGIAIGDSTLAVVAASSPDRVTAELDAQRGEAEVAVWQARLLNGWPNYRALPTNLNEVPLPNAPMDVDLTSGAHIAGSTLIVPPGAVADAVDTQVLQAWRSAGVAQVLLPHRQRPWRAFLRLKFNRHRGWKRAAAGLKLRLHSVASWWGLFSRKSHHGRLLRAGPFRRIKGPPETDVSLGYAVFRGLRQLYPVPASHEEIATGRAELYSIWSQMCFFKPAGRWPRLQHYWAVEQSDSMRDLLPIAAQVYEPRGGADVDFYSAIRRKVNEQRVPPHNSLAPGDKVVVFTHSLHAGGAERQWCYLAIGLRQRGFVVHFLVQEPLEGNNGHYRPLLERHGIVPQRISDGASAHALSLIPRDPGSLAVLDPFLGPFDIQLLNLTARLLELQPNVVFAQLDIANLQAGVACVMADVPRCVLSFRNYNPTHFSYLRNEWYLPCYQALIVSPRIVLSGNSAPASADYATWLGIANDRVNVVPNSIEPDDFDVPGADELARLRDELGISAGTPVILGVFRLSEEKDPNTFIHVCERVAKQIPGVRVFIVGVGPLKDKAEALIESLHLRAAVMLLGRRTDISALMQVASIGLLTSTHEGMPNVVMEAQLFGLPMVATRAGGTPDIIVDGATGYVRPIGDIEGLASACISLLRDVELRAAMGAAARKRTPEQFSKARMVDRYIELAASPAHCQSEESSESPLAGRTA